MVTHSLNPTHHATRLFRQHYRSIPQINAAYWSFTLGGMVDVPLHLSYSDIQKLPAIGMDCVIACAGNPPGGAHIGQAHWQGVSLNSLLDEVSVLRGTLYAHLHAADGYSTSIEITDLERAVLAYGMNGAPLPSEHGYPARLIVPGLYGYKMPKWIQRIVLADQPLAGFWEKRGWSASGQAKLTSAILSPRHQARMAGATLLSGIAYAGNRQIASVEVSIDGGDWMPVSFTQMSPHTWAEWSIAWTAPGPDDYQIRVRAADDAGFTQSDTHYPAFPNGSSGIHAIVLRA